MARIQSSSTNSTTSQAAVLGSPTPHDFSDTSRHAQGRFAVSELFSASMPDEVLVVEERAHLRPAQVVESRLTHLLQGATIPASHLQARGLLKTR